MIQRIKERYLVGNYFRYKDLGIVRVTTSMNIGFVEVESIEFPDHGEEIVRTTELEPILLCDTLFALLGFTWIASLHAWGLINTKDDDRCARILVYPYHEEYMILNADINLSTVSQLQDYVLLHDGCILNELNRETLTKYGIGSHGRKNTTA